MIADGSLLVALLEVVARIPLPPPPPQGRGRPVVYADRLFLQGLVIMIVRRLETVSLLVAVLHAPTEEMARVRALRAVDGRLPQRRTWERRLARQTAGGALAAPRHPQCGGGLGQVGLAWLGLWLEAPSRLHCRWVVDSPGHCADEGECPRRHRLSRLAGGGALRHPLRAGRHPLPNARPPRPVRPAWADADRLPLDPSASHRPGHAGARSLPRPAPRGGCSAASSSIRSRCGIAWSTACPSTSV